MDWGEAEFQHFFPRRSDPEAKDEEWGRTPLLWAASYGDEAVVQVLLEHGADIEAEDIICGRTPLSWAVKNGHEAVVKLLLGKNSSCSAQPGLGDCCGEEILVAQKHVQ
ncbi:ankyrin repeat protein [Penicillium sp. IBT 35674x]|nr:ankyrin repeat protein [Penicillium sp. IBT 35674x]